MPYAPKWEQQERERERERSVLRNKLILKGVANLELT
jgi:hypothetical protein